MATGAGNVVEEVSVLLEKSNPAAGKVALEQGPGRHSPCWPTRELSQGTNVEVSLLLDNLT